MGSLNEGRCGVGAGLCKASRNTPLAEDRTFEWTRYRIELHRKKRSPSGKNQCGDNRVGTPVLSVRSGGLRGDDFTILSTSS